MGDGPGSAPEGAASHSGREDRFKYAGDVTVLPRDESLPTNGQPVPKPLDIGKDPQASLEEKLARVAAAQARQTIAQTHSGEGPGQGPESGDQVITGAEVESWARPGAENPTHTGPQYVPGDPAVHRQEVDASYEGADGSPKGRKIRAAADEAFLPGTSSQDRVPPTPIEQPKASRWRDLVSRARRIFGGSRGGPQSPQ